MIIITLFVQNWWCLNSEYLNIYKQLQFGRTEHYYVSTFYVEYSVLYTIQLNFEYL